MQNEIWHPICLQMEFWKEKHLDVLMNIKESWRRSYDISSTMHVFPFSEYDIVLGDKMTGSLLDLKRANLSI